MRVDLIWLAIITAIVLVVGIIAGSITSYNVNLTNKVSHMVAAGVDPIKVNCAMYGGTGGIDCNLVGR